MRSRSVRRRPWLVRSVATLLACLAVGPGRAAWAQCEQWIHGGGSGPTGLGTTEAVVASMTTWDPDADGPEPARLVVAGARQLLPDIAFPNSSVLTWDGARWQSLGLFVASSDLVNGPAVNALIVHNGALVAGGAFFINGAPVNIARWTGSQWEALGGGITGTVRDLAIHNGDLVAGGLFTAAGGLPVSNLARWDGSAWHDLGGGTNQEVRALEVLGPDLVLAGSFTAAGGAPAQHVARWDGSAFAPLGGGLVPPVWSLGTYAGTLVAGEYGGTVRRWDGAQWLVLGGLSGHFQALLELDGALYAAGGLPWTVARWDGSAWAPTGIMSSGGSVRALGVFGGQMVAGGWFNSVSHEGSARTIPRLARWDGQGWHTVDGGLAGHGGQTRVLELLSQGDRLYFSGEFTRVDGSNSSGVASLGPDGWAVYSVGVTPAGASLRAVAVHEEVLHVGGTAGVARLVGGAWEHLGGPPVYDLAVHEGDLYAAGSGGIRRRAGETWQWLGQSDGGTIRVNEAVFHDGQVFACGAFGSIGGIAAANVARWDGTQWHPLGSGVSGEATGLAFWN
ncbi:MAG TPA: hypothetical protein VD963_08235, partial [Phycisphaerales bacterium]|nr:hypothetical protein [Phycisphaerales bacterium]